MATRRVSARKSRRLEAPEIIRAVILSLIERRGPELFLFGAGCTWPPRLLCARSQAGLPSDALARLPSRPNVTKVQLPDLYLRNLDKGQPCLNLEPGPPRCVTGGRVLTRPRA